MWFEGGWIPVSGSEAAWYSKVELKMEAKVERKVLHQFLILLAVNYTNVMNNFHLYYDYS